MTPSFAIASFLACTFAVAFAVEFEGPIPDSNVEVEVEPGNDGDCLEADFQIVDLGYNDNYRGWYDPLGCGICNQYCRWVGNSGSGGDPSRSVTSGSSWWSCQVGIGTGQIWPRMDAIDSTTTHQFRKCSGRNAEPPPSYLTPYGVFDWLDQRSDTPRTGLSCVIRQANRYNGGRILTAKGNDVVVQGRDPTLKHQRWIIHNRRDTGSDRFERRTYNIWAQDSLAGNKYLSTARNGNTGLWNRDDGSNRQRWILDYRFISNRYDHQFTIRTAAGGRDIDLYQEYLSNHGGNLHHVELASRAQVREDDAMTWELIDCQEIVVPGSFYIRLGDKVLDVPRSDCDADLQLHSPNGGSNQQFVWGPTGQILNKLCHQTLAPHRPLPNNFFHINECGSRVGLVGAVARQYWIWNGNGPISYLVNCYQTWTQWSVDPELDDSGRPTGSVGFSNNGRRHRFTVDYL